MKEKSLFTAGESQTGVATLEMMKMPTKTKSRTVGLLCHGAMALPGTQSPSGRDTFMAMAFRCTTHSLDV